MKWSTKYEGISGAWLGIVGPHDLFPLGINLHEPTCQDGLQYGIASAGDNTSMGHAPVTGTNALIKNSVVFTLIRLRNGFLPSDISNVFFSIEQILMSRILESLSHQLLFCSAWD